MTSTSNREKEYQPMTSVTGNHATVGDLLRRAAQIMQERGQCKGSATDDEGRVCIKYAICEAADGLRGDAIEAWAFSDSLFPEMVPAFADRNSVVWNDDFATQTEVEKFLLACADRADFPDPS